MGAAAFTALDEIGFNVIPFPLGQRTIRENIATAVAEGVVWVSERDPRPVRSWQINFPIRTDAEDRFLGYLYRLSASGVGIFDFEVPGSDPTEVVKVWLGLESSGTFSRRYISGGRSTYFATLLEVK